MNVIKKFGSKEIECPDCKSILEIIPDDVVEDDVGALEGKGDCFCRCVVCAHLIPLNSKDLHPFWIKKIFHV